MKSIPIILWRLARLTCPLLAAAMAACGGGGGDVASPQPVAREWQKVPGGLVKGFQVCGSGIVRIESGTVTVFTDISYDHGMTWQSTDLRYGSVELGDTSYYWRQSSPPGLPLSDAIQETRDCGVTWTPLPSQIKVCLQGNPAGDIWRGGDSNQIVYAQYRDPTFGQYFICVSSDGGQSWTRGPPFAAPVGEVRRGAWFAWIPVSPVVLNGSPSYLLFRSSDQGESWQSEELRSSQNNFPTSYAGTRITPSPPVLYMFLTTQQPGTPGFDDRTLWHWDDASATWTSVAAPLPLGPGTQWQNSPAVNPANPQQIFIMTFLNLIPGGASTFPQRIFETRDAGLTWIEVTDGLSSQPYQVFFDPFLVFDPTPTNHLYLVHYFSDTWMLGTGL